MILSRQISRKGEASGKAFHHVKTRPSRMLRPCANYWYHKDVAWYKHTLRLTCIE